MKKVIKEIIEQIVEALMLTTVPVLSLYGLFYVLGEIASAGFKWYSIPNVCLVIFMFVVINYFVITLYSDDDGSLDNKA